VGESVGILRELQELTQIEERSKVIARAPRCHPAALVFPGWDVKKEAAA
jgi:hypothetical protein